jgi:DNA-binding Xre family transcriptional regulator
MTDEEQKYSQKLGKKIEKLYLDKFNNQYKFCEASGIDYRTMRRIISGKAKLSIFNLEKICQTLNLPSKDILGF